jgi:hypothetical protein
VEIGAEAAQFPEKEYINGIAVAVYILIAMTYSIQASPFLILIMMFIKAISLFC